MPVEEGAEAFVELLNAGRALNRGLDANLRWRAGRRVAINGGYAYLRSTNLAPYIPRHKATYTVEFDLGRAFLHFGGMTVSSKARPRSLSWTATPCRR